MSLLNILIVDDSEEDAILIANRFRASGYGVAVKRVETAEGMASALAERAWDAIFADVAMPSFSAVVALDIYNSMHCDCPFIVVTGTIDEDSAVLLLKAGAHDFVLKSNLARLAPATEREMRETEGRRSRLRAEAALVASEERYALAVKGALDGLWDWDIRAGGLYFSPRWADMLGLPENECPQTLDAWFLRIHPDDAGAVRRRLNDHLERRTPHFSVEYRVRHGDGNWIWMLARGLAVFDDVGRPVRMAGSQTDISPRKRAEQELRRSRDELEQAVKAKTRFLAAASHDLRQPLQALVCFASILEAEARGESAISTFRHMTAALESMKGLLDALLDISKLDAGLVETNLSDFHIGALLEQIASEVRPQAEAKNLRLGVVGCSAFVRSDSVLLGRMLRNLVENAIRYTERGSVLIGCRRRGASLVVTVCDTGIGIAEDARTQIFEEFYQIGNSERDRTKGLGLGLSIVGRLGGLLGHPVGVQSVVGRGSTFTVSAPAVDAPRGPVHTRASGPALGHGAIVVIDDETEVAIALAGVLRAWGFEPVIAAGLDEAQSILQQAPRAILADYRLREGRTGIEAIQALHRQFGSAIPSIVVTGDIAADHLRDIREHGAIVLHKPVLPRDLKQVLDTVLADKQDVAEAH